MTLDGMNALITGGAGGIGRATAGAFLAAGARVVIADVDRDGLSRALEDLAAPAGQAAAVECDIADPAQCDEMVARAEVFFGAPLDICLANAGRPFSGGLLEASPAEIRAVIDVNVTGTILTARSALRSLIRGRQASLLLTGSLQSVSGRAERSVYTASRHAVVGLVRSLALEVGPRGVRVNGIAPTVIDTPFLHAAYAKIGRDVEAGLAQAARGLPLGRIPTVEDFAQAAVFLASPAAGAITGHLLMVDCGASAGKF
jgi:NAD(P)-dependent dehydrogenase (short-subunit alcohol dehydrogenase family)